MLVCFEGLDRSGKTTLLKATLGRVSCIEYRKPIPSTLTIPDHSVYFWGAGMALAALHGFLERPLLVDRSLVSDWIYSDGPSIGWSRWHEWETLATQHGPCVLVYVEVDDEVLRDRLHEEPDDYLEVDSIALHRSRYQQYLARTSLPTLRCAGDTDIESTADRVVSFMNEYGDIT